MSLEGNKGVPRSGDERSSVLLNQGPLLVPIERTDRA